TQQNVQVAAGQIGQAPVPKGQQFQYTINTLGRLADPQQFADIIIKVGQGGPAGAQAAQSDTGSSTPSPGTQPAQPGQPPANGTAATPVGQAASIVRL